MMPSKARQLPPAVVLPCSLQLKTRPLLKPGLPAVHTGPTEVLVHMQSSHSHTKLGKSLETPKGEKLLAAKSLPMGPPMLFFAGAR